MPADVRLIAFYLPQFHPIPENNEWWGPGFTEWTNISQGRSYYPGHYQPRVPADLGYYDLRVSDIRHAQARLARDHGIHGFCYYYYWFSGRRLLERPLDLMLADRTLDFPFCVCWANENWSRRWDGSEQEILMEQKHLPEDAWRFMEDLAPVLTDPRYITVDGAPLLLVYRPAIIPNVRTVTRTWRQTADDLGIPHLHLCGVQSFGYLSGLEDGFDSMVEFPPHGLPMGEQTARMSDLDPAFKGRVFSYPDVIRHCVGIVSGIGAPVYRGVMTGWDNTPRRRMNGYVFEGSTPERYYVWLKRMIEYTRRHHTGDRRLVFINAWNEWAEGAYLEPDEKFQHQYLEATAQALSDAHDAAPLIASLRETLNRQQSDPETSALLDRLERTVRIKDLTIDLIDGCGDPPPIVVAGVALARFQPLDESSIELPELAPEEPTQGRLETLNTPNYDQTGVTLVRAYDVLLTGWVVSKSIPVTSDSPILLQFTNLESGTRYLAKVQSRVRRDDVVAHLSQQRATQDISDACSLYSGYRASLNIAALEPGSYKLDAMLPAPEGRAAILHHLHSPAIVL
jgi:hypothetical protein